MPDELPPRYSRDVPVPFVGRNPALAATPKIATNQTAVVSNVRLRAAISWMLFQAMVLPLAIVSVPLLTKLASLP